MLNTKTLLGLIIIAVVAGALAFAFALPEKTANCQSGDAVCPQGCTYANDADCLHSTVTSSGELKRCLADSDCVFVQPICGNENCNFNDVSCKTGCSCGIAINKDYKNVYEAANVKCLPSGAAACAKCQTAIVSMACISGECRTII